MVMVYGNRIYACICTYVDAAAKAMNLCVRNISNNRGIHIWEYIRYIYVAGTSQEFNKIVLMLKFNEEVHNSSNPERILLTTLIFYLMLID